MNSKRYIFSQVTSFLPQKYFNRLVAKYDDRTKDWVFSHWNHMLLLILGQLMDCISIREPVDTVNANFKKNYYLGIGENPIDFKDFIYCK